MGFSSWPERTCQDSVRIFELYLEVYVPNVLEQIFMPTIDHLKVNYTMFIGNKE